MTAVGVDARCGLDDEDIWSPWTAATFDGNTGRLWLTTDATWCDVGLGSIDAVTYNIEYVRLHRTGRTTYSTLSWWLSPCRRCLWVTTMLHRQKSQRVGHASLPGPTAPLVTELLQLPVAGYGTVYRHISRCRLTIQSVPAVTKDIFVWIVRPQCSANYFNCAV